MLHAAQAVRGCVHDARIALANGSCLTLRLCETYRSKQGCAVLAEPRDRGKKLRLELHEGFGEACRRFRIRERSIERLPDLTPVRLRFFGLLLGFSEGVVDLRRMLRSALLWTRQL